MFPLKLLIAGDPADAPEDSSENLDRFTRPYCYRGMYGCTILLIKEQQLH